MLRKKNESYSLVDYFPINANQAARKSKRERKSYGKTFIFTYNKLKLSDGLEMKIREMPQFYLSTLLSAALRNNSNVGVDVCN